MDRVSVRSSLRGKRLRKLTVAGEFCRMCGLGCGSHWKTAEGRQGEGGAGGLHSIITSGVTNRAA
jgi:hypothetical protein